MGERAALGERTFALQFAVFQGFPKAVRIEMLIRELAAGRGN
jgi:hypothetical protein